MFPVAVRKFRWLITCGEKDASALIPLCGSAPLCHQSSPPVIAPHSPLPPCQFSAPHLASVARAEKSVVGSSGGQSSSAAPAPLLLQETWPPFAGTTLHTAACQPPTPLRLARNIKVSSLPMPADPAPSRPALASQPLVTWQLYLLPLLHCHPSRPYF